MEGVESAPTNRACVVCRESHGRRLLDGQPHLRGAEVRAIVEAVGGGRHVWHEKVLFCRTLSVALQEGGLALSRNFSARCRVRGWGTEGCARCW